MNTVAHIYILNSLWFTRDADGFLHAPSQRTKFEKPNQDKETHGDEEEWQAGHNNPANTFFFQVLARLSWDAATLTAF